MDVVEPQQSRNPRATLVISILSVFVCTLSLLVSYRAFEVAQEASELNRSQQVPQIGVHVAFEENSEQAGDDFLLLQITNSSELLLSNVRVDTFAYVAWPDRDVMASAGFPVPESEGWPPKAMDIDGLGESYYDNKITRFARYSKLRTGRIASRVVWLDTQRDMTLPRFPDSTSVTIPAREFSTEKMAELFRESQSSYLVTNNQTGQTLLDGGVFSILILFEYYHPVLHQRRRQTVLLDSASTARIREFVRDSNTRKLDESAVSRP